MRLCLKLTCGDSECCREIDISNLDKKGKSFDSVFSFGEGKAEILLSIKMADPINGFTMLPYVFSLTPSGDTELVSAEIYSPLGTEGGEVYFYDAANCTNAFACIRRYEAGDAEKNFFSRDIFMSRGSRDGSVDNGREVRGEQASFEFYGNGRTGGFKLVKGAPPRVNMAFTTFRRFFTCFRFERGHIVARYELESKRLEAKRTYELEHIFIDDGMTAQSFFEMYTGYLAATHNIPKRKYTPKGWSSWSCYYNNVDEEKVIRQSELVAKELAPLGADLIQLDDGWQKDGSFGAYWTTDYDRFPGGMERLKNRLDELGLRFGLWLAPGLVRDTSEMFDKHSDLLVRDGSGKYGLDKCFGGDDALTGDKNGAIYAFDISKEEVLEMTAEIFERAKAQYGSEYFKIDFITNLLYRVESGMNIIYPADFATAAYRRFMQLIRDTVGEDVFLLACGAPIGESVGIFDSVRISPDISWGGAGKNGNPEPFEIIMKDAQNIILRSPYHNRVFINDPDALLVRDYLTEYGDDGLILSYDEAKLWATVVLMSGGHIILNEEIDRLPEDRLALVKKTFELSRRFGDNHAAARPKRFFEFPYCTESFIPFESEISTEELFVKMADGYKLGGHGTVICSVFNWDAVKKNIMFNARDYFEIYDDDTVTSKFIAEEIWTGERFELNDGTLNAELPPHSCICIEVKRMSGK